MMLAWRLVHLVLQTRDLSSGLGGVLAKGALRLTQSCGTFLGVRQAVPGQQYGTFGVLTHSVFSPQAWLPAPALFGYLIDSSCIWWWKKCNKSKSCVYYNLDFFRHR